MVAAIPANIVSWSDTQIIAKVAPGSTTGVVLVTVSGFPSNSNIYFTIPPPQITGLSPSSGGPNTPVTVTGSGFRGTQSTAGSSSTIFFNGVSAAVTSWSDNQILVTVPASATTGPVKISGFGATSNSDVVFTMPNPVISSITPSSAPVNTQVQINGSGFGATQPIVKFSTNANATVNSWTDTQITVTVPTSAVSGGVSVTAGGVTSNSNINFTIPGPQITSISPTSGIVNTPVTITGSGFQNPKASSSTVTFGSANLSVGPWSDTQIQVTMPAVAGTRPMAVTVNGVLSNQDVMFTMPNPVVTGVSPAGGPINTPIQVTGSGFGSSSTGNSLKVGNGTASINTWSDTLITATVAQGATSGAVMVTNGGISSVSNPSFTVANLYVTSISPQAGPVNTPITISGTGFGSSQGSVTINGVPVTNIQTWNNTQITATVPSGATTGAVKVTVGATSSNTDVQFTVGPVLVTGVTPSSGLPGASFQINGSGFGSSKGNSTVTVHGFIASTNDWSDTSITAIVPATATSGAVTVTVGGVASNATVNFTVLGPVITGLSPSSAAAGTQIQVTGTGFGSPSSSSNFRFSGTNANAQIVNWSDTLITARVPDAASSGRVFVSEGSLFSNTNFNFTIPDPKITSISPASGIVGAQVTIIGSGFRGTQGSVSFNGTTASVVSWIDTQIVANVPSNAKTGPVMVATASSATSNLDLIFTMPNPIVSSVSPTRGPTGTQVQILGSGFGGTQGSSTLTFNTVAASIVNWSDTSITATVPNTATTGAVAVTVGGVQSNANINFNIPAPVITSISPNRGNIGTQITVTGANFQSTQQANSGFTLATSVPGSASPSIISWSDTQIVATVPINTITGPASVVVNRVSSNNDVEFSLINPQITSLVPATGPVGTQVTINGSGFGASQGSSSISFNAGATGSVVSWSDSKIVATVPAGAKSGPVSVNVANVLSNQNINFTVPAPRITGISPTTGAVGTNVTITGSGFQTVKGTSYVTFNGTPNTGAVSWSDTQIVVTVPPNATSGAVTVQANNGQLSNSDFVFTMPNPIVTGLVPASGPTSTQVQINGSGFGATQGSSTVTFNNVSASVVSWADTQIVAAVPPTAISGPVQITEGGVGSNSSVYFNVPAPQITSMAPAVGGVGNSVTITGSGFQSTMGSNSSVTFAGGTANIKNWSDTQIVAVVPTGALTGSVKINVNGISSNNVTYTVPNLFVNSLAPNTGPVGTQVTIAGTAFGATQGTSVLTFNGQVASPISWSDTQIVANVPVTAASGPAVVTVNGVNSNATTVFTVPPPAVSSYTPTGGLSGTQVTVLGSGFQPTQRDSTLTINGTPAAITSWSDTQIVANVPTGATTGPILVNVNSVSSASNKIFEVPNPVVAAISSPEAPAGGSITITGSGFGASDKYSPDGVTLTYVGFVNFNGITVGATAWSDTSITTNVPPNATTGPVTVLKYNATSNSVPLTVEGSPTVTSISPDTAPVGGSVTLTGTGFESAQRTSTVNFNGAPAVVTAWSDTQITAIVPPGASTGPVGVIVDGINGPTVNFTLNSTVQVTDSLGHITSYSFKDLGGQWHNSFSMGSGCSSCTVRGVLNKTHDTKGNLLTSTDELNHATTYTYDPDSQVLSVSTKLDATTEVKTSYTYNSFGEPLLVTDPLGNVTTNEYDANGNLKSVTTPSPDGGATPPSVTIFAYDLKGQLTLITDPLGHHTTLTYWPTGLIKTIADDQSNTTNYEYDQRGNRTAVVDAMQNRTTFDYDLGNRLTKITYPDNTFISFGYDSRGRRTSVIDQNLKTTTYAYDDADRLTSATDAAQHVTTYAYDTENNLLSITDAAQRTTSFSYDAFGRVTQTTFPAPNSYETYLYDAVGNLTNKTDRKGQSILYVYDALNRLTHKGYPDATGVDYVYDLAGKIKQVTDPTGTYGLAYDNMGRLVGTATSYSFLPGDTYTNAYTYDAASNRTGFTAPDGSTNAYGYDTLNRLTSLADSQAGSFTFAYDALSRRTGLTRPNGVNTSYGYDSLSRLLNVLHQAGTTTLDGAGYAYDASGNRASKSNYLNNVTENYIYDASYQLTQVTQGATTTENYSYDAVGNRLSSLGMSPYTYNSSNQLTSTLAATFTYDGNGNTLTKTDSNGTTTYTWDFENRLTSVQLPSQATVAFKYDPFGRRIQKGASAYVYEGQSLIEEVDGNGTETARYVFGPSVDEPLIALREAAVRFYQTDGLGSITSLSTGTGLLSETFGYDSFGNVITATGAFVTPFRFTGREWDGETGLHYYRARYYDPILGRFLSEDPIRFGAGIDFYSYVNNNPTNLLDPLGLAPLRWPNAKTRACNSVEYSECSKICGSKGVESCRVSQTFRVVRWKDGKTLWKWADGPLSCSCNEEECDKQPQPHHYAPPIGIPVVGPIIDKITDPIVDWLGPRWEELKNWHPPRPTPGWGPTTVPGPITIPVPIFVIP